MDSFQTIMNYYSGRLPLKFGWGRRVSNNLKRILARPFLILYKTDKDLLAQKSSTKPLKQISIIEFGEKAKGRAAFPFSLFILVGLFSNSCSVLITARHQVQQDRQTDVLHSLPLKCQLC